MNRCLPILILAWACLLLGGCDSEPARSRVVGEIKSVSKLATLEAQLSKIVYGTRDKKILGLIRPKDATFLAYSEATVKVGIDLDKIRPQNIQIDGKQVSVALPPIEIINFSYPAEKFEPNDYYIEKNIWNDFSHEDEDELFRLAEISIQKSIPYLGITKSAEKQARRLMTALLKRMGFQEIYIEFLPSETIPANE